jgi:hypothetical protein
MVAYLNGPTHQSTEKDIPFPVASETLTIFEQFSLLNFNPRSFLFPLARVLVARQQTFEGDDVLRIGDKLNRLNFHTYKLFPGHKNFTGVSKYFTTSSITQE